MDTPQKHLGVLIHEAMIAKGVGLTAVGKHFDVKPQSVKSWINSGRVAKKHLQKLVDYFGHPLPYWLGATDAKLTPEQVQARAPERLVTLEDIAAIWPQLNPERQRRLLTNAHDFALAQQFEKASNVNPYAGVLPPAYAPSPSKSKGSVK